MKKTNIGALFLLAGVAVIGFIWFKKNKPKTSKEQLATLTKQLNELVSGNVDSVDKPFSYSQEAIDNAGSNPFASSNFNLGSLTDEQIKDIKNSIGQVFDSNIYVTNQIAQNMQGANFSQLNLSDIKIV